MAFVNYTLSDATATLSVKAAGDSLERFQSVSDGKLYFEAVTDGNVNTYTITATKGACQSTNTITLQCSPVVVTPPITGTVLAFKIISYDCITGILHYMFTGGDSTVIVVLCPGAFVANVYAGIDNSVIIDSNLRNGTSFTGTATQSGTALTIAFTTSCSAPVSQNTSADPYFLVDTIANPVCINGQLQPATVTVKSVSNADRYKLITNNAYVNPNDCTSPDGYWSATQHTVLIPAPSAEQSVNYIIRAYNGAVCGRWYDQTVTINSPICTVTVSTQPFFTLSVDQPTCSAGKLSIAYLRIRNAVNTTKLFLVANETYNGSIDATRDGFGLYTPSESTYLAADLIIDPVPLPGQSQVYTVRGYNGTNNAQWYDQTITVVSPACLPPITAQLSVTNPVCTNGVLSNGIIKLTGITNGYAYYLAPGNPYNGPATPTAYSGPSTPGDSTNPPLGALYNTITGTTATINVHPPDAATTTAYSLRVWSTDFTNYYTFQIQFTSPACTAPASCTPPTTTYKLVAYTSEAAICQDNCANHTETINPTDTRFPVDSIEVSGKIFAQVDSSDATTNPCGLGKINGVLINGYYALYAVGASTQTIAPAVIVVLTNSVITRIISCNCTSTALPVITQITMEQNLGVPTGQNNQIIGVLLSVVNEPVEFRSKTNYTDGTLSVFSDWVSAALYTPSTTYYPLINKTLNGYISRNVVSVSKIITIDYEQLISNGLVVQNYYFKTSDGSAVKYQTTISGYTSSGYANQTTYTVNNYTGKGGNTNTGGLAVTLNVYSINNISAIVTVNLPANTGTITRKTVYTAANNSTDMESFEFRPKNNPTVAATVAFTKPEPTGNDVLITIYP